jgi:hypothetical protein
LSSGGLAGSLLAAWDVEWDSEGVTWVRCSSYGVAISMRWELVN